MFFHLPEQIKRHGERVRRGLDLDFDYDDYRYVLSFHGVEKLRGNCVSSSTDENVAGCLPCTGFDYFFIE